MEPDQELGHLVERRRQVVGRELCRAVDPVDDQVRGRDASVSSYRYGSGTAKPSRWSAASTPYSFAVTVRPCCLKSDGSVLTEHDPPPAAVRCGDVETEHVRRDTTGERRHVPTSRPPGSSSATACSIPDVTSTAATLRLSGWRSVARSVPRARQPCGVLGTLATP